METTAISHIGQKAGGQASVLGWLYGKRSSGKIQFLIVRDGTGYLQAVVPRAGVWRAGLEAARKAAQRRRSPSPARSGEDKRSGGPR
jgi:asparaginyl-tRNA synthetase